VKSNLLTLFLFLLVLLSFPAFAQQSDDKKASAATPADSEEELRRAIENSGGSETQMIANFESYLKTYPNSSRRGEIENEIYKLSVKMRDRNRAIIYAEKLINNDSENIEALTSIVAMLRERRGEGDLNKALSYADQLVKQVEDVLARNSKPKRMSVAQWLDRKERGLASVYLLRGKVHADLGNNEKAQPDLRKSYDSARLADAALSLGEIAEKRKNTDEALDYYVQAFVIALNTAEEIDLKALRKKLGELYTEKKGSEAGLGDRILKAHDQFIKERDDRIAKLEPPNINEGVTDPLKFTLTKLEGSTLAMESLRGKVIAINFWATWCGPCLVELPLFEKAITKYKNDKDVVFLAISSDEDRELVKPYLKEHKFNLPVVYADNIDSVFGITSYPTTLIIDRKGEVSYRLAGYNSRQDYVSMLSEQIEAAKKK
jgi:thiol-disulfide isomerase/thioredoxin